MLTYEEAEEFFLSLKIGDFVIIRFDGENFPVLKWYITDVEIEIWHQDCLSGYDCFSIEIDYPHKGLSLLKACKAQRILYDV